MIYPCREMFDHDHGPMFCDLHAEHGGRHEGTCHECPGSTAASGSSKAQPATADITSWLLEQIAEDERAASVADPGPWRRDYHAAFMHGIVAASGRHVTGNDLLDSHNVHHITRQDPARTLRRVAAYRAIIDLYDPTPKYPNFDGGHSAAIESVLELLASEYSDRPGYNPEWSVT